MEGDFAKAAKIVTNGYIVQSNTETLMSKKPDFPCMV